MLKIFGQTQKYFWVPTFCSVGSSGCPCLLALGSGLLIFHKKIPRLKCFRNEAASLGCTKIQPLPPLPECWLLIEIWPLSLHLFSPCWPCEKAEIFYQYKTDPNKKAP